MKALFDRLTRLHSTGQRRRQFGFQFCPRRQGDFILAVPKGFAPRLQTELVSQQPLMAPVSAGQTIATLKVSLDGKPYGEYPVVALEAVPVAGAIGRAIDSVRLWFK